MEKEVKPSVENPLPKEHEGEISIAGGEPKKIGPNIQERTDNKPEHNDFGHDMRKAGAKFSADTMASLKSIHAAGDDNVKSMVRGMLGDDASMLDSDSESDAIGLVNKAVAAQLASFKADLIKELSVSLAKSQTEPVKTPVVEVEPVSVNGINDVRAILLKAISG